MAEKAKEKKVTLREVVRDELAKLVMEARGMEEIGRTKEGLVLREGEETVVIKVILKKDAVEKKDIVETLKLAELVGEAKVAETAEAAEEVTAEAERERIKESIREDALRV